MALFHEVDLDDEREEKVYLASRNLRFRLKRQEIFLTKYNIGHNALIIKISHRRKIIANLHFNSVNSIFSIFILL